MFRIHTNRTPTLNAISDRSSTAHRRNKYTHNATQHGFAARIVSLHERVLNLAFNITLIIYYGFVLVRVRTSASDSETCNTRRLFTQT